MINELRLRKLCICTSCDELLLADRLEVYLKSWDIPFKRYMYSGNPFQQSKDMVFPLSYYSLMHNSFGRLLMEPREKEHLIHAGCEIVILNDSVDDLRVLLDAFPELYNGRSQKVLFFSGISDYQVAEKLLLSYRPLSVAVVKMVCS